MLVVSAIAYAIYLSIVLGQAGSIPLMEVPYAPTLLWSIGGAIAASIVMHTAVGTFSPKGAAKKDQRDRDIYRLGEYTGQSLVVMGGVAALLMAMAEWDHFWIANVIYLGFVLSAILGSVAKIGLYRFGFHPW